MLPPTLASPVHLAVFSLLIAAMLALDLGWLRRETRPPTTREALGWTLAWVALALAFGAWIHFRFGPAAALEYTTGYAIEKALSVDNIFIFLVIFRGLGVPPELRRRALSWGVLGALFLRAAFILAGAAAVAKFRAVLYFFGLLLVVTGFRLLRAEEAEPDPTRHPLVVAATRFLPTVEGFRGERFLVREDGRLRATPLLIALIAIEVSDLVFALDSIPTIFAITRDPFLIITSNLFAVLGLRSLFFLLADALESLSCLRPGLAAILVFVGAKLLLMDLVHVPIELSLATVGGILGAALFASWLWPTAARVAPPAVLSPEEP